MDELIKQLTALRPGGEAFGMQIMVDPATPANRIRFVDPVTGLYAEFTIEPASGE